MKTAPRKKDEDVSVDIMSRLDGVNAPKQARSEKRLQDIAQALERLLQDKPFEKITIPDIAAEAGCGTGSIYGRFRDKNSILIALHESIRERQLARVASTIRDDFPESMSVSEIALYITRNIVNNYTANENLARASYILGEAAIYERVVSVIRHISQRLTAVIIRPDELDPGTFDRRIDLAARTIYALMQQRMIFHPLSTGRYCATNDEELAKEMASVLVLFAGHKVDPAILG